MGFQAGQPVLSSTAPGWVAESNRQTVVGSITTTETALQSVTFAAVAGVRYKVTALQSIQASVAGDLIQMRLRWNSGATFTTGGTELYTTLPNADVAGKGQPVPLIATVTGLSGTVSVGVTAVRSAGTGTITSNGDSRQTNTLLVERV